MDSEGAKSDVMREMLDRLWERSLPVLHERLDLLDVAAAAASVEILSGDLRAQAIIEAHKLAGSLGMFGYSEGTELAREIETVLESAEASDPMRLTMLTTALRATLFPPST